MSNVVTVISLKGRKPFVVTCDGKPKDVANVAVRELAHVLAASLVPMGA